MATKITVGSLGFIPRLNTIFPNCSKFNCEEFSFNSGMNLGEEKPNNYLYYLLFVDDLIDITDLLTSKGTPDLSSRVLPVIKTFSWFPNGGCIILFPSKYDLNKNDLIRHKVQMIHHKIMDLLLPYEEELEGLRIIESKQILETSLSYSNRNFALSRIRVNIDVFNSIDNFIYNDVIRRQKQLSPTKLIIVDLDNTLWGGVIGEDRLEDLQYGSEGIGKAYLDIQQTLLSVKDQGILIAVASKNNHGDVVTAFDVRKDFSLKLDDFVVCKANWEEKSSNINEIVGNLNIGYDSVLFIDDNPVERAKVQKLLPLVKTLDLSSNIFDWHTEIIDSIHFISREVESSSVDKKHQYDIRQKFEDQVRLNSDLDDVLSQLKQYISVQSLSTSTLNRSYEMVVKTNQFNTSLLRMTKNELKDFVVGNADFLLFSLKDIYGDHGIIGMVQFFRQKNNIVIGGFWLSCRAMGRNVEYHMLNHVLSMTTPDGEISMVSVVGPRNKPARDFINEVSSTEFKGDREFIRKLVKNEMVGLQEFELLHISRRKLQSKLGVEK